MPMKKALGSNVYLGSFRKATFPCRANKADRRHAAQSRSPGARRSWPRQSTTRLGVPVLIVELIVGLACRFMVSAAETGGTRWGAWGQGRRVQQICATKR